MSDGDYLPKKLQRESDILYKNFLEVYYTENSTYEQGDFVESLNKYLARHGSRELIEALEKHEKEAKYWESVAESKGFKIICG